MISRILNSIASVPSLSDVSATVIADTSTPVSAAAVANSSSLSAPACSFDPGPAGFEWDESFIGDLEAAQSGHCVLGHPISIANLSCNYDRRQTNGSDSNKSNQNNSHDDSNFSSVKA